ncbi:MAG: transposase, partial [Candidatus Bipolaricaulis sp.]|nr:transposase [Candidatus Bipolaricaulis sp.]
SAFLNWAIKGYCDKNEITFTRCRSHKKNDRPHIEQKNGAVVRRPIGYDRDEGPEATATLQAVYDGYRIAVNSLQPVRTLEEKRQRSRLRYPWLLRHHGAPREASAARVV